LACKAIEPRRHHSTDAEIDRYALMVLADDRKYFPRYAAALRYQADLPQRLDQPATVVPFRAMSMRFEGKVDRQVDRETVSLEGRCAARETRRSACTMPSAT
jgi:hypothetical protein